MPALLKVFNYVSISLYKEAKMKNLKLAVLAALLFNTSVYAADELTKNAVRHDDDLNRTYKSVLALLDSHQKTAIKKAQLKWISYRDDVCEFEGKLKKSEHWIESQISNPVQIACISRLTLNRTKELNQYIDLLGGDSNGYVVVSVEVNDHGMAIKPRIEESTLQDNYNWRAMRAALSAIYHPGVKGRTKQRYSVQYFRQQDSVNDRISNIKNKLQDIK